jgi:hypothetical protein
MCAVNPTQPAYAGKAAAQVACATEHALATTWLVIGYAAAWKHDRVAWCGEDRKGIGP